MGQSQGQVDQTPSPWGQTVNDGTITLCGMRAKKINKEASWRGQGF